MAEHRTIAVAHPSGEVVDLDVGISDFVQALWVAGIDTAQSCEDLHGDGYAWVAFPSFEDLRRFVSLVGADEDRTEGSMWMRMAAHEVVSPDSTPELDGEWRYRLLPCPGETPASPWVFAASVELPRGDLLEVIRRLPTR